MPQQLQYGREVKVQIEVTNTRHVWKKHTRTRSHTATESERQLDEREMHQQLHAQPMAWSEPHVIICKMMVAQELDVCAVIQLKSFRDTQVTAGQERCDKL